MEDQDKKDEEPMIQQQDEKYKSGVSLRSVNRSGINANIPVESIRESQIQSLGLFSSLKQPAEDSDALLGSDSSDARRYILEKNKPNPVIKRKRMNWCQTFFAVVKGYTTLNIFLLPIGFKEGGWLFSPIALIVACTFETLSAIKLSEAAHKVQIYNYPDLVEYCFGSNIKVFLQVIIGLLCFGFTFCQVAFLTKTLQTLIRQATGETVSIWIFAGVVVLILGPLTWIRTIESFKMFFIFCSVVILGSIITISTFDGLKIQDDDGEAGPGWQSFNDEHYWNMIGLSFYMFEGIPTVLPIMDASDAKEHFSLIVALALGTLCIINIGFSELCYYAYGDDIKEPLIILQMPEENPAIIIDKILFCFLIVFSYPLTVYVCNQVLDYAIFRKMEPSSTRKWLKNLMRIINLIIQLIIAITFYYSLHKILGFFGVTLGTIVVIIMPACIHYKLVSESKGSKCCNIFIIIYGVLASIIIGTAIILTWNDSSH